MSGWKWVGSVFLAGTVGVLMASSQAQEKDAAKKEEAKQEEKKPEEKKEEKKETPRDTAQRMREASEKLRRTMDKAAEDYRRAMDKAHEEFRAELDRIRAEGGLPRPFDPPFRGRGPLPGKLGLIVSPVLPALAEQIGLDKDKGLMIVSVMADGPGGKAGLKEHDVLVTLDGKQVTSRIQDLERILADIKPKTPVDAEIYRRGKKETIKGIELAEPRAGSR